MQLDMLHDRVRVKSRCGRPHPEGRRSACGSRRGAASGARAARSRAASSTSPHRLVTRQPHAHQPRADSQLEIRHGARHGGLRATGRLLVHDREDPDVRRFRLRPSRLRLLPRHHLREGDAAGPIQIGRCKLSQERQRRLPQLVGVRVPRRCSLRNRAKRSPSSTNADDSSPPTCDLVPRLLRADSQALLMRWTSCRNNGGHPPGCLP
jgi:hypothetical protein